jgi:hypothetical protein
MITPGIVTKIDESKAGDWSMHNNNNTLTFRRWLHVIQILMISRLTGIWASPGVEIIQAGITRFNATHLDTDHRMLWVDFSLDSLFGYRPPPLAPIIQSGVTLTDPENIKLFNDRVHV